jgi:hypothetical protein
MPATSGNDPHVLRLGEVGTAMEEFLSRLA